MDTLEGVGAKTKAPMNKSTKQESTPPDLRPPAETIDDWETGTIYLHMENQNSPSVQQFS